MIEISLMLFVLVAIIMGHIVFSHPRYISTENTDSRPVSIIVPARNEAHNLPSLLESIAKQHGEIETIIVNDRSTDETLDVIQGYNIKLVNLDANPWNGKSYVCYSGVPHAAHDTLLFLDADTMLSDANAIEHILGAYTLQNNRGILSIQPFSKTFKIYEKLSTVFNLMTVMGVNVFSAIKTLRVTSTVFGPALLTNKSDYELTGGHAYAKDKVIEGEGLHEAFAEHTLPIKLYLGKGNVNMQMYPRGIKSLINGWAKHIASGSGNTHPLYMLMIILFLGGGIVSFSLLVFSFLLNTNIWLIVLAYILYGINFTILSRRVITMHLYDLFLYPLYIFFFFCIYGLSWYRTNIRKTVTWKGRKIKISRKNNNK